MRSSSPKRCTGLMLDVLSAVDVFSVAWWLVALVAFERLCCSMLQSAQAMSSSDNCYSIALACQHQQCNQTSKRTCIPDAADAPPEPASVIANVGCNAAIFFLAGRGSGVLAILRVSPAACALVCCIGVSPVACALVSLACVQSTRAHRHEHTEHRQHKHQTTQATHSTQSTQSSMQGL